MTRVRQRGPDGVLVVDKPDGPTSHDVVSRARRVYGTRSVGHAGTLDPMATGVLVLVLGEATKLSGVLTRADKEYRATVRFGAATDTLDARGAEVERAALPAGWLELDRLHAALDAERARTLQVPPAVSAIRVGGEHAYQRARRGEGVVLEERCVAVRELELHQASDAELVVRLRVSKGYYVRAFARDLGLALGVPAHLAALRRTASGSFDVDEAVAWPPAAGAVPELLPIGRAVQRALPCVRLADSGVERARQGKLLEASDFVDDVADVHRDSSKEAPVAWLDAGSELVALGARVEGGYRVVRGFRPPA